MGVGSNLQMKGKSTYLKTSKGKIIKYTVLPRSTKGTTMARRSWNNAAPKGSFMHGAMCTHAASIGTNNKSTKVM